MRNWPEKEIPAHAAELHRHAPITEQVDALYRRDCFVLAREITRGLVRLHLTCDTYDLSLLSLIVQLRFRIQSLLQMEPEIAQPKLEQWRAMAMPVLLRYFGYFHPLCDRERLIAEAPAIAEIPSADLASFHEELITFALTYKLF